LTDPRPSLNRAGRLSRRGCHRTRGRADQRPWNARHHGARPATAAAWSDRRHDSRADRAGLERPSGNHAPESCR